MAAGGLLSEAAAARLRQGAGDADVVPDRLGKVLADLAVDQLDCLRPGRRSALQEIARTTRFFAPGVQILEFPAWDRSPTNALAACAVVARRMATLAALPGQER